MPSKVNIITLGNHPDLPDATEILRQALGESETDSISDADSIIYLCSHNEDIALALGVALQNNMPALICTVAPDHHCALAVFAEAVGIAIPGMATLPAGHINRRQLLKASAALAIENSHRFLRPTDILTPRSIANGLNTLKAVGASEYCNAALASVSPLQPENSQNVEIVFAATPEELNRAGGVMTVMAHLASKGLINTDAICIEGGRTLRENLDLWAIGGKAYGDTADELWRSAPAVHPSGHYASDSSYFSSLTIY